MICNRCKSNDVIAGDYWITKKGIKQPRFRCRNCGLHFVPDRLKVGRRKNRFNLRDIKDSRFYYLIGALEGDGTDKPYSVRLSVKDYDFAMYFYKVCREILPFRTHFHYYNSDNRFKVDIHSKDFRTKYHMTPETLEQKIEYLKGIFDAEGCFCLSSDGHRLLSLTSGDVALLKRLRNYLNELQIRSTLYYASKKRNCIRIYGWGNQSRFMDIIGFRIGRKMSLWDLAQSRFDDRNLWKGDGTPDGIQKSIVRNYLSKEYSLYELSEIFGLCRQQVRKILKRNDIDIGRMPIRKRPKTSKYQISLICHAFTDQKINITRMPEYVGTNRNHITIILRRCGLV